MSFEGSTEPGKNKCAYCGAPIEEGSERKRFCSKDCLTSYGEAFRRNNTTRFSLAEELSKLQDMVVHEASRPQDDYDNTEQMLGFYEQVVERAGRILKTLNTNALITEQHNQQALKEAEEKVFRLNQKLDVLLRKAGDLKKQNKRLKSALKKVHKSHDREQLARVLLGVKEEASKEEIKKAFREKAKNVHPDRSHGDADLFKALSEALQTLVKS